MPSLSQPTIISKLNKHRPLISVEFFPAKTEEATRLLIKTAHALKKYNLDFVSVTYGAAGSIKALTYEYADILANIFGLTVMPHLTCISLSEEAIDSALRSFDSIGLSNIMTLRGDMPKEENASPSNPFHYASDLVRYIKKRYPHMCLGVGGYPETHPQAISPEKDIDFLKEKIEAGADFITTQLFFDNQHYFNFKKRCQNKGITSPIIAGILIPNSLQQIEKFSTLSGSTIPSKLRDNFLSTISNEQLDQVGINWAWNQISELLENHVDGIHLYILNRSSLAIPILEKCLLHM